MVADHFMSAKAVTWLCAFDRERVDVDVIRHLSTLHPLSNAERPEPQSRSFVDDGTLWIEGDVNTAVIEQAMRALKRRALVADVIVDLASTSFVTTSLKSSLHDLT